MEDTVGNAVGMDRHGGVGEDGQGHDHDAVMRCEGDA